MDNLGVIVSEVGDVVTIGKKCMNSPYLEGKGKRKQERKKKKRISLQFLPRKRRERSFSENKKEQAFFVFCTYVLITT